MMDRHRTTIAIVLVLVPLLRAGAAGAQGPDIPGISFNGFGTVGVVRSNEDRADFAGSVFHPDGAGHSRAWSAEVDSRLGLQLTANATPRLSAVVQLIVEQRYDESYTPTVEWANVKYELTPDLYVRAGRVVLPALMHSEYRKVGFALPWVRPPQEVYNLLPLTNSDGVDAGYRFRVGAFTNTLRIVYGRKDSNIPGDAEIEARDALTVSDTLERGALALHFAYSSARLTIAALDPLFDAFRQFGAEGEAIADRFDVDAKRVEAFAAGARYDPGRWFVLGEWARFESRTFIGDRSGWYLTGGYRIGDLTPYLTFARTRTHSAKSAPGLSITGLPPPLAAAAAGLNATLDAILGAAAAQKSLSVGARWDFAPGLALKVQFDHLDLDAGSPGVLINSQLGFRSGGSVSLFSAALDFVF